MNTLHPALPLQIGPDLLPEHGHTVLMPLPTPTLPFLTNPHRLLPTPFICTEQHPQPPLFTPNCRHHKINQLFLLDSLQMVIRFLIMRLLACLLPLASLSRVIVHSVQYQFPAGILPSSLGSQLAWQHSYSHKSQTSNQSCRSFLPQMQQGCSARFYYQCRCTISTGQLRPYEIIQVNMARQYGHCEEYRELPWMQGRQNRCPQCRLPVGGLGQLRQIAQISFQIIRQFRVFMRSSYCSWKELEGLLLVTRSMTQMSGGQGAGLCYKSSWIISNSSRSNCLLGLISFLAMGWKRGGFGLISVVEVSSSISSCSPGYCWRNFLKINFINYNKHQFRLNATTQWSRQRFVYYLIHPMEALKLQSSLMSRAFLLTSFTVSILLRVLTSPITQSWRQYSSSWFLLGRRAYLLLVPSWIHRSIFLWQMSIYKLISRIEQPALTASTACLFTDQGQQLYRRLRPVAFGRFWQEVLGVVFGSVEIGVNTGFGSGSNENDSASWFWRAKLDARCTPETGNYELVFSGELGQPAQYNVLGMLPRRAYLRPPQPRHCLSDELLVSLHLSERLTQFLEFSLNLLHKINYHPNPNFHLICQPNSTRQPLALESPAHPTIFSKLSPP